MLKEQPCRQVPNEYFRRWISDDYIDLIIWQEPDGRLHGFQLCYDKAGEERALTWTLTGGFSHRAVEAGDTDPNANCTPILVADESFQIDLVREEFLARSAKIDSHIRDLVISKLKEYESHRS